MFCKNCGKEIADGSSFCTNCGARVENSINQGQPSN
ncbi:MAG: zinc-ribbon domain-containing protein [Clostridia bacterium]